MIGAILGGVQGALGIGQTIAGLVKKKPEIPDYDIPAEVYENMTDAEYWSFQGLPEAQKQQFVEQSQRAGATALSRSSSRKGGLGLVSSIAQQEQDSATQLLSMDAEQRFKNLQQLYRSRDAVSAQKGLKYEHDLNKVLQKRGEIDNMRGAGIQNIVNAAGTVAGIDSLTEGGIFGSLLKKKAFAKATAPGSIKPEKLATGVFSGGTYDKLPFGS